MDRWPVFFSGLLQGPNPHVAEGRQAPFPQLVVEIESEVKDGLAGVGVFQKPLGLVGLLCLHLPDAVCRLVFFLLQIQAILDPRDLIQQKPGVFLLQN